MRGAQSDCETLQPQINMLNEYQKQTESQVQQIQDRTVSNNEKKPFRPRLTAWTRDQTDPSTQFPQGPRERGQPTIHPANHAFLRFQDHCGELNGSSKDYTQKRTRCLAPLDRPGSTRTSHGRTDVTRNSLDTNSSTCTATETKSSSTESRNPDESWENKNNARHHRSIQVPQIHSQIREKVRPQMEQRTVAKKTSREGCEQSTGVTGEQSLTGTTRRRTVHRHLRRLAHQRP